MLDKCGEGTTNVGKEPDTYIGNSLKVSLYPTVLICNLKNKLVAVYLKKTCCAIDLREKTCREERSKPPLDIKWSAPKVLSHFHDV